MFKKILFIILILAIGLLILYYIYVKIPKLEIIDVQFSPSNASIIDVVKFKFGEQTISWRILNQKEVVIYYNQGANNGYSLQYYYKSGKAYFDLYKNNKFIKNLKTI